MARRARRWPGRGRVEGDLAGGLTARGALRARLGAGPPGDRLRIDAPIVRRALRTGSVVRGATDWVWPHWLERQLDPTSPAFVSRGDLPFLANVTARNWTTIGNVGSACVGIVDQRGLVTAWPGGWSLDWWVGAEDRWHLPSREPSVRQRLVADSPVVETAMRVPGGDVVHRTFAIRSPPSDGAKELVVVEVANATPVPVALAVAVRPYDPEGTAVVERIQLDGTTVTVDGRVAMVLPRPPNRAAGSTFDEGDVATTVLSGDAGESFPAELRCEVGMASAAFIYPLPHRATMSFLLPLVPQHVTRRRGVARRAAPAPETPSAVPTGAQVANGWRAHAARGVRLVLPDARVTAAVEANRRFLLVLHDGDPTAPGRARSSPSGPHDATHLLGALDRYGYAAEVAEALAAYPRRQRGNGSFPGGTGEGDVTGRALHTIGEHRRLHRDTAGTEGLVPVVAAGAEWIARTRAGGRSGRRRPGRDGLLGAGASAVLAEPCDASYLDDLWGLRGLLDAADVLEALGEGAAALGGRRSAERLRADIDASLASVAPRLGTDAIPAGPGRRIGPDVIGSLAACWPLRLMEADDPRIAATAELVRARFCSGPAFFDGTGRTGSATALTLQLALVELEAGDRRALERFEWLLSVATPTWTWPEAVHPRLDGGCAGDGHHGATAAGLLTFVRNVLVRETSDGGLALCSMLPPDWLGQPLEVHDAPTHHGRLSFAVRWHGDRPALLWELVPHDGATTSVRVTAPGLDPSWSTRERRGDALLAPVPPPPAPEPEVDPIAPVTPVRLSRRRPGPC